MNHKFFTLCALAAIILVAACSRTVVTGSWKNPEYAGTVGKVYIVGISSQETYRRILEDEFGRELQAHGAIGIPSYRDLADPRSASKDSIAEHLKKNGADSVLMTRIVNKRTESVVTPGRVTSYGSRPYYDQPYPYTPDPYYRHWGSYYDRSYETIYEPATVTQLQIVTIEANLYEAGSGDLIWSAQLDTVIEANIQKMIAAFVNSVVRDLRQQGLL